jgi:predicted ATPase
MRLNQVWINGFKNLNDFSLSFDQASPYTVLVGQNGSGKSNLIEALVYLFSELDSQSPAPFDYQITYGMTGHEDPESPQEVTIRGEKGKIPVVRVNRIELSRAELSRRANSESHDYLPRFVFVYYSGPTPRLTDYFAKSQERFYQKLKHPKAQSGDLPARRMFLAQTRHSQFVLLAFYSHHDPVAQAFLKEHLSIVDVDFIKFVIRKPSWAKSNTPDRFWGTTGIPRQMIELLERFSIATTKTRRKLALDFRRNTTLDCWNFLLDRAGFEKMASQYATPQDLFKALESTDISELLFDLEVTVKIENVDGSISHHELSEGEQQLLLVLGLLRFTKQEDALFLLDEPDTHLNPSWSVQFLNFIDRIVGEQPKSHVIMATHDPLVFAGLRGDQVRIMDWAEDGRVTAREPEEDPRGMGVEAILTSDLFGLRAAVDLPTLEMLDDRQRLMAKEAISPEEELQLADLSRKIEVLGYGGDYSDPTFVEFTRAFSRWREQQNLFKPVLTAGERRTQHDEAVRLVQKIKAGAGVNDDETNRQ